MPGGRLKGFLGRRRHLVFFLAPALTLITIFYLVPLILSIYISLTPLKYWQLNKYLTDLSHPLENYYRLFYLVTHHPDISKVVITTVVFTGLTLVVNVLGGLLLALATYLMEEKFSLFYRTLWLLPRMTPIAVYSLLWYYFFHGSRFGILNSILLSLGVIHKPVWWGVDEKLLPWGAWMILVYVNGLVGVSFGMIIFYSALRSIPREQVMAARVDGATTTQLIRYILVPSIKWHIVFVTVWELLSLLTTYAHIFLLVEWGLIDKWWGTTWALFVFNTAFTAQALDQGLAAAAATVLVAIGLILGLITLKLMGFKELMVEPRGEL